MATYNIKPELAKAFQSRFPNRASSMIEGFIQNMLRSLMSEQESQLDELKQKRVELDSKIEALSSDLISIDSKIEALETTIENTKKQEQTRLDDLRIEFEAFKIDSSSYHKFKHAFIKSGKLDEGLEELDFYKEYRETLENGEE